MDSDGDTLGGGPNGSDAIETYIGTDPAKSCSASATLNNEPMDNFILDLNDDKLFTGQDTGAFGGINGGYNKYVVQGPFNGRPGVRYDFNVDGIINGQDTGKYGGANGYFNKVCVPSGP